MCGLGPLQAGQSTRGGWEEAKKDEISAGNGEQERGSTEGHNEIAVVIFSGVKVC